ncbi:MAG: ATP-binding cassette domain-containing protein [Marinomonas sp.]
MTDFLLEFKDIQCGYGDTQIIHGISGGVKKGETLAVFGRNGVGKTTLSRALTGEIPVTSGSVNLDGARITKKLSFARRRDGISYMPQTGMVFDKLTVRENLSLANSKTSPEMYFDIFPRLAERLDQQAGSMSGGERKILSFVRVMLEETLIAVLDEPSEGVQPENIENMQNCILAKQKAGCSFILIEQNLSMLLAVADCYLGVESGRVVFEGDKTNCQRDDLLSVLSI